jgi:hypothetical protein
MLLSFAFRFYGVESVIGDLVLEPGAVERLSRIGGFGSARKV